VAAGRAGGGGAAQPQSNLPSTTQSVEPRALDQYELRPEGRDRVAGRDAVVFLLQPRDSWRFAQRLWADQETGLMLRSDVIGPGRTVLESAAFSEVEIGVKAQPDTVLQPIRKLDGLRVLRPAQVATPLEAQGWTLNRPVAGFRLVSCVKRPVDAQAALDGTGQPEVTQAVYSDGLTHVSLFIEPLDPRVTARTCRPSSGPPIHWPFGVATIGSRPWATCHRPRCGSSSTRSNVVPERPPFPRS
jgi:sigma-E factor negative regulatory protein RseB